MNSRERAQINRMIVQTNYLMDGKGNGISTADVVESILGDLRRIMCGQAPEDLATLVQHDELLNRAGLGA